MAAVGARAMSEKEKTKSENVPVLTMPANLIFAPTSTHVVAQISAPTPQCSGLPIMREDFVIGTSFLQSDDSSFSTAALLPAL